MSRLLDAYVAAHKQGFIPIFVHDEFDTMMELDACLEAGVRVIEYTQRRQDAATMIPRIRHQYPDLFLLVGSTLDDERIVRKMRVRHPQLRTIAELEAFDPDGYVSMAGWGLKSIRKYSRHRSIIPSAMTVTEALQHVGAGAHLIKMAGSDLNLVQKARLSALFDFCPIFVTGGMTYEKIPEAINAGAVMVASGFDLILRGMGPNTSSKRAADEIRNYIDVTRNARAKKWPGLHNALESASQDYLDALPHYHPF